jgi:hypothetical protein
LILIRKAYPREKRQNMNKTIIFATLIFVALNFSAALQPGASELSQSNVKEDNTMDWENPAVFGRNKEPAHCTYIPYPDTEGALKNNPSQSPYYFSLNGTWKFNWVKNPSERPVNFFKDSFIVSKWNDILLSLATGNCRVLASRCIRIPIICFQPIHPMCPMTIIL